MPHAVREEPEAPLTGAAEVYVSGQPGAMEPPGEAGSHAYRRRVPRHRQGEGLLAVVVETREVFGPLGVRNIRTFVDPQDSSKVAIVTEVADMDAVMAAMRQPSMGEAMEYDGVVPETLRILIEEKRSGG